MSKEESTFAEVRADADPAGRKVAYGVAGSRGGGDEGFWMQSFDADVPPFQR